MASKKSIIMHTIAEHAPMNSQEIFDKTNALTGQNKQRLSVTLAELQRAGLIERNRNSRYEITDQGDDWVTAGSQDTFRAANNDQPDIKKTPTAQPAESAQENIVSIEPVALKKLEPETDSNSRLASMVAPAEPMPDRHTITELQHIQQLAQQQLDAIALQTDEALLVAKALIEIRNTCQELIV